MFHNTNIAGASCAADDLPMNSKCYRKFDSSMTWYDASNDCLSRGGSLAVFTDIGRPSDNRQLTDWLNTSGRDKTYWIGLVKSWWNTTNEGNICCHGFNVSSLFIIRLQTDFRGWNHPGLPCEFNLRTTMILIMFLSLFFCATDLHVLPVVQRLMSQFVTLLCNQLAVLSFNLSTVGKRALPVSGANLWNSFSSHESSAPSRTQRLKTFLFYLSYPDFFSGFAPCFTVDLAVILLFRPH